MHRLGFPPVCPLTEASAQKSMFAKLNKILYSAKFFTFHSGIFISFWNSGILTNFSIDEVLVYYVV